MLKNKITQLCSKQKQQKQKRNLFKFDKTRMKPSLKFKGNVIQNANLQQFEVLYKQIYIHMPKRTYIYIYIFEIVKGRS